MAAAKGPCASPVHRPTCPAHSSPGPLYISSHSADVILSDIRPVKLDLDALGYLNTILDEILASVVLSANSLSTDKLKAGLLRVLPTPLGKEALLEAELELRAYWERTKALPSPASANGHSNERFNVQWAVEVRRCQTLPVALRIHRICPPQLMRLKCEAYSTLNDSDEDAQAERRLHDRMGSPDLGCSPALVAPAALYMTAILECVQIIDPITGYGLTAPPLQMYMRVRSTWATWHL
jgi:hypothetical protein